MLGESVSASWNASFTTLGGVAMSVMHRVGRVPLRQLKLAGIFWSTSNVRTSRVEPDLFQLLGLGDEFLVESALERLVVGDGLLQL